MEDKKLKIIAFLLFIALIILIVVSRVCFDLSKTFFLIAGAGTAAIVAVVLWFTVQYRANKRRRLLELELVSEGTELRIEYSFLRKVAGVPTKFRYKEIEEATDDFKALLGEGASASVFKGVLNDGTSIAVKRIDGEEHGEKEFKSEVAAIASVQHVNLVRLLGYCIVPGGPRYLVYDFISNGSLDNWIFPQREGRNRPFPGGCLSWDLRYRVAIEVAKALSYLHRDCRSRILHLDVKPENILLDENYMAHVSDFGLSKLMGKDESRVITTIRGTRGYLAPEWLLEHGISDKCDVYSYGMVLLEMVGGRRNVRFVEKGVGKSQRKYQYFPKLVSEKIKEGKLMEVVDQRLIEGEGVEEMQVKTLVYTALWCIQERARLRPTMARVVEMLEGRAPVDEPPDTSMVIVDFLSTDDDPHEVNEPRFGTVAAHRIDNGTPSNSTYSFTMSTLSGR
ncbi:Protein kinase domain [Dillenia turbinata]|uniref:Protein kinase domain n=1 Tax=Dillenia turbinata TaxID=194707 RepID=A0AAN8ZL96_9MAGN